MVIAENGRWRSPKRSMAITENGHGDRRNRATRSEADRTSKVAGFRRSQVAGFEVIAEEPNGLSGGPVYYIRPTRAGSPWSPSSDATLIGIATEFTKRRELALPWWRWSEWVREALG